MPVHDWTRADAGVFHDFHLAWTVHLSRALNELPPKETYALMEEQGQKPPLHLLKETPVPCRPHEVKANEFYRLARRTIAVRYASDHRLAALIEVLSPLNKRQPSDVRDFVKKVNALLQHNVHVLVIDLHPATKHDPNGIHAAIWESFDPEDYVLPKEKPLTLAAYAAGVVAEAYVEHLAVGDALPDMPLFLTRDYYVNVPLEATYQTAYRGVPAYWRNVIEGGQPRA